MGSRDSGVVEVVQAVLRTLSVKAKAQGATVGGVEGSKAVRVRQSAPPPLVVVRLNGAVQSDDSAAFKEIVAQLRSTECGNVSFADNMAFLTEAMQVHAVSGVPTVFVLHELHDFAARGRQTLLYTLLDMTHRSDMIVSIVGVTGRANVLDSLEKRVRSRFRFKEIAFLQPGFEATVDLLRRTLMLEEEPQQQQLVKQHNKDSRKATPSPSSSSSSSSSFATPLDVSREVPGGGGVSSFARRFDKSTLALLSSPSCRQLLYSLWARGRTTAWLKTMLSSALCSDALSPACPYLTLEGLKRAQARMEPDLVMDALKGLPVPELLLLACMARIEARQPAPCPSAPSPCPCYSFSTLFLEVEAYRRAFPSSGHKYGRDMLFLCLKNLLAEGLVCAVRERGSLALREEKEGLAVMEHTLLVMQVDPITFTDAVRDGTLECPSTLQRWCTRHV